MARAAQRVFLHKSKKPGALRESCPTIRRVSPIVRKIEFGRIAREYDCTPDQLRSILEREKQKSTIHPDSIGHSENGSTTASAEESAESDDDRTFRKTFERQSPAKKAVLKNILQDRPETPEDLDDEEETESDEYTPPPINFQKRIQSAEEKGRIEVDKIARERELSERLTAASKYS